MIVDEVKPNSGKATFFTLANEHVNDLFEAKNFNRGISDRCKVKRIKEFLNGRDIIFEEINVRLLRRLQAYLVNTVGQTESSAIYSRAIKQPIDT